MFGMDTNYSIFPGCILFQVQEDRVWQQQTKVLIKDFKVFLANMVKKKKKILESSAKNPIYSFQ